MTGEFAELAAIQAMLPAPSAPGEVWMGDDAAVLGLPDATWLLLAADTVVAGVHADLALTGLDDFGWKALAASVSDIAAMGGRPLHSLVTVAGPPGTDLGLLYEGLRVAAAEHACPIVGGDLANAPSLVVTVAVTGSCERAPVLRSGARPGDGIWVTGPLGASAAGLRCYQERAVARVGGTATAPCRALMLAHARPRARLSAGLAARDGGATAMIDVSDGLSADLGHVADASGVGIRLDRVPVAEGATEEDALGGGEDFELVFCAADPGRVGEAFAGLPAPLRIGVCTEDPGERTLAGRPLALTGWEHRW